METSRAFHLRPQCFVCGTGRHFLRVTRPFYKPEVTFQRSDVAHSVSTSQLISLCLCDSSHGPWQCVNHRRSHKPSRTLSSNHQGIPCSPSTLLSVRTTVPKHFGFMVGVHFLGVNSNWIFLFL